MGSKYTGNLKDAELENFKRYKVGYRQTGCRVDMQQSCICPDRVNRGVIRLCLRQVWAAPLMGGARAVVMFNRHVSSVRSLMSTT